MTPIDEEESQSGEPESGLQGGVTQVELRERRPHGKAYHSYQEKPRRERDLSHVRRFLTLEAFCACLRRSQ